MGFNSAFKGLNYPQAVQHCTTLYNIVQTHNIQYITKNCGLNAVRIIIFKIYEHHNKSYENISQLVMMARHNEFLTLVASSHMDLYG